MGARWIVTRATAGRNIVRRGRKKGNRRPRWKADRHSDIPLLGTLPTTKSSNESTAALQLCERGNDANRDDATLMISFQRSIWKTVIFFSKYDSK